MTTNLDRFPVGGTFRPLSDGQVMLLHQLRQQQESGRLPGLWNTDPGLCGIRVKQIRECIQAQSLPIDFSPWAFIAAGHVYVRTWEDAAVLLVDCLHRLRPYNNVVQLEHLEDLYPNGFFDQMTVNKYIDDYMVPGLVPFGEVYES